MSKHILVSGWLRCQPQDTEAFLKVWKEHVRLSRLDPGCIRFNYSLAEDRCTITLDEEWTDRFNFDLHTERTRSSDWAKSPFALEKDYQITEQEA